MPEKDFEEEEEVQLFLCQQDCFDGVRDYRKGERYPISPKSPCAKYFKLPESLRPKEASGADKKGGGGADKK